MMKCNACIDAKTGIALEGETLEAALKDPNAPRCSCELSADDVFCPSCGAKVASLTPQVELSRGYSNKPENYWFSLKGRSTRKEYLKMVLHFLICCIVFNFVVYYNTGTGRMDQNVQPIHFIISVVICAIAITPVSVRRLHDLNDSGWLLTVSPCCFAAGILLAFFTIEELAVALTPFMAGMAFILVLFGIAFSLVLFVLMGFKPGTKGPNKYGPVPLVGKNATTGHTVLDGNL